MIKFGNLTIMDWKQEPNYYYNFYVRDIYVDNKPLDLSCITIKNHIFLTDDNYCIERWIIIFGALRSDIYDMFCLIHGQDILSSLNFETAEDAKDFVDNTLEKIFKLKAFL